MAIRRHRFDSNEEDDSYGWATLQVIILAMVLSQADPQIALSVDDPTEEPHLLNRMGRASG